MFSAQEMREFMVLPLEWLTDSVSELGSLAKLELAKLELARLELVGLGWW